MRLGLDIGVGIYSTSNRFESMVILFGFKAFITKSHDPVSPKPSTLNPKP